MHENALEDFSKNSNTQKSLSRTVQAATGDEVTSWDNYLISNFIPHKLLPDYNKMKFLGIFHFWDYPYEDASVKMNNSHKFEPWNY